MHEILTTAGSFLTYLVIVVVLWLLWRLFYKYLWSLLDKKLEAADLEEIRKFVSDLVDAAEQRFVGDKLGISTRKPWVIKLLNALGVAVDDYVESLIDAEVGRRKAVLAAAALSRDNKPPAAGTE